MNVVENYSQAYLEVRALTEHYCAPLSEDNVSHQPVEYVSPPKWHLGHTSWFFEELVLKKHKLNYQEFHPDFSYAFNSYYNTVGPRVRREARGSIMRPSLEEVYEYRKHIDREMIELLEGKMTQELHTILNIGLNHEQQHQELLLMDIKFILSANPMSTIYKVGGELVHNENQSSEWIGVKAGLYEVGAEGDSFSYDNERQRHQVYLYDCTISTALVTNQEFQEFIDDNGYYRHELWLDEGWAWVNNNNISAPLYWQKTDNKWMHFTLGGLLPVPDNAPLCHVSHYEAAAFAEWKCMRLPTEFEWEVASGGFQWGQRWEHMSSAYLPYPGFQKPKGAVGEYNGKFMINQMVLRGSSVATSPCHSRKSYRNFFHPNMRWQFGGIRLIKDEK
ncbi:MAG: ergothioneine biosynthesis protein EgtB [Salibacteraceae bacterium]